MAGIGIGCIGGGGGGGTGGGGGREQHRNCWQCGVQCCKQLGVHGVPAYGFG